MALTTAELDSLRHHLGYGNLSVGAEPYTPDTYYEVFSGVVSPNLSTGNETTASTGVDAGVTASITVVSATGITANGWLVIDTGDQAEIVSVKAVSGTSVTAAFTKAHTGTYPVATMSGLARLRLLLWDADTAWRKMTDVSIGATAGLKSLDNGAVEWFQGFRVLTDRLNHYKAVVSQISSLVQVPPQWASEGMGAYRLSAY